MNAPRTLVRHIQTMCMYNLPLPGQHPIHIATDSTFISEDYSIAFL